MSGLPGAMRVERERVLLVEGADEVNFVVALMGHHFDGAAAAAVQVIPVGGRTRFRERLRAVTMAAERRERALHSTNRDKSFAHAWLASCRDPVARVGEAARQGAWNFDHPAFAPLVRFVQRLVTVNP